MGIRAPKDMPRSKQYQAIWNGQYEKSSSGTMTKSKLMKNPKSGKIVSKALYKNGVKRMEEMKKSGKWTPFEKGSAKRQKSSKKKTPRKKSRKKSVGRKRKKGGSSSSNNIPLNAPLFSLF